MPTGQYILLSLDLKLNYSSKSICLTCWSIFLIIDTWPESINISYQLVNVSTVTWSKSELLQPFNSFLMSSHTTHRGPHRYRRTVRVPILRPKILVKKRIISSRYIFTGTMTKPPRCWYSRQGRKECRDAGSAGKYIANSRSRHPVPAAIETPLR